MPRERRPRWPWDDADFIRLRHILDAAAQIRLFAAERGRESLRLDDIPTLGLIKAVEIIGEAASVLDPEVREAAAGVPWPKIIAMRHRLVHAYFDIDLEIVWATATKAVPQLERQLTDFLGQWDTTGLPTREA